jgi:uncharacterized Tic20 family protein
MGADTTLPEHARTWAMLCHLSALVGLFGNGLGFIVGPLIVWLIKRNDHPFIDDQGREALNFQITLFILAAAGALLLVLLVASMPGRASIGLILAITVALAVLAVADVVLTVIASIKANGGERYRYPFAIRFL